MTKYFSFFIPLLAVLSASAAIPSGYYKAMEGKSKADLKAAAKSCARSHTVIDYGNDTWDAFRVTDVHTVGGALCWWDMYSNNAVKVSNGHPGMNIEHSVANSWWGGTKNDAYKDLFHLNPSDSEANNRKQNYPLGIVVTATYDNGVTTVGHPVTGECGGAKNVYEPADCYKGDFARTFFYMFTIYDDISWSTTMSDRNYMFDGSAYPSLRPWAYQMLLEWAKNDPVDQKEIDRNEAIYGIQHNRNPYIDFPELAEYVWGSKTDMPFYADEQPEYDPNQGGQGGGQGDDPEPPIPPVVEPVPDGAWARVTDASMLSDGVDYILVSVKDYVAMGYTDVNSKAIARAEDVLEVSESGIISYIGSDVGILRLEPSGAGWLLHLYDQKGSDCGYLSSTVAKTVKLGNDPSVVTITPRPDNTLVSFGEAGNLQYNVSSPRFCTYTTLQQGVHLYRHVKETNVVNVAAEVKAEVWFDLTGRAVNPETLQPGIYIRAGKKVVVK